MDRELGRYGGLVWIISRDRWNVFVSFWIMVDDIWFKEVMS